MEYNELVSRVQRSAFWRWLGVVFSEAKHPVFTSILGGEEEYYIRIRDSNEVVRLFPLQGIPKVALLCQPHIKELYEEDKEFATYLDRRC